MNTDERFSISEAVEITGVGRGLLTGWLNRGLLRPTRPSRGHGRPRLFAMRDLVWLAVAHRLTTLGVRAEQAAQFADETVDIILSGRGRWLAFVPCEYGFEFSAFQSAADMAQVLEPFGRPGPSAALVIDGGHLGERVQKNARALLEEEHPRG